MAPDPPWFDLILAAETRRMPAASKIVKITDDRDGDDGDHAQGSPIDIHQAALFALGRLTFFGLAGASSRGSSAYVGGVAAASTNTSWLSVTLAWLIL